MADRKFNQKREDSNAARDKGKVTRAVGTTRGPGMNSQPPSLGLSRSAISNASFIDYRGKPGDTARETMEISRMAGPTFNDRLATYHQRLTDIDRRNVRDTYSAENNDIINGHPFGKRPPVIKGTQNTTSPKSAPDIRSGRDLRKLASDTRAGHRGERGKNVVLDQLNEQNVRNANNTALMHENAAKSTANAHANAYYGRQTDRMREMTGNKRQPGRFDGPAPDSSHLDFKGVAPSDMHRSGTAPSKPAPRTSVPEGMKMRDSGGRSMGVSGSEASDNMRKYQKSRNGIADVDSTRRENAGMLAGALTVPLAYGVKALYDDHRQQTIDNNVNRRRDDASDMGPVKGRALERSNQFEGGRPKTAAELNQEKDVATMKKNGTSLTKALVKDAKK